MREVEVTVEATTHVVDDEGLKFLEFKKYGPTALLDVVPLPYEVGDDHLQALEGGYRLAEVEMEVGRGA